MTALPVLADAAVTAGVVLEKSAVPAAPLRRAWHCALKLALTQQPRALTELAQGRGY